MEASSISVRLRRTTTEVAYVLVPMSEAISSALARGDGAAALSSEALRLAKQGGVQWLREDEPSVEVHPTQKPR